MNGCGCPPEHEHAMRRIKKAGADRMLPTEKWNKLGREAAIAMLALALFPSADDTTILRCTGLAPTLAPMAPIDARFGQAAALAKQPPTVA